VIRRIALVTAAAGALAACQPDTFERAGEDADSAFEEATKGEKDLTDGPMENAGEAIDKARADAAEAAKDAGDAIERKTDGDKTTN
jgi:predicted small secreted protein